MIKDPAITCDAGFGPQLRLYALLLLLAATRKGVMPGGLYKLRTWITSNTTRPIPGWKKVAPKLVETGTFHLLCEVRHRADGQHVQEQDDGGKDG